MDTETAEVLVVGGGVAGLAAALQLARARRSVVVVDEGKARNRFAKASHGVFALDGLAPSEMIGAARVQLACYPAAKIIDGVVASAAAEGEGFTARLASGEALKARLLVLAFGVCDHLPEIPGLAERWGHSVLHCAYCHGFETDERPQGVLRVGPRSIGQALAVADWGPTTLVLDGEDDLDAEAHARLAARGVAVMPGKVTGVVGETPALTGLTLADGRQVALSALYLQPTTTLNSPIARELGCALEAAPSGPRVRVDASQQTTVSGVFAAGDIARAANSASFALADGAAAGVFAHQALIFGPG